MKTSFYSRETLFLRYAHTYTARAVYVALKWWCVSIVTPKTAQNPIFWPHGHSMPPRSKNSWNFRNFIAQRIKINFYFYFNKIYFIKNKKYKLFFLFSKNKFFIINYFFFDLVESKGYMPLCRTTALLARAM